MFKLRGYLGLLATEKVCTETEQYEYTKQENMISPREHRRIEIINIVNSDKSQIPACIPLKFSFDSNACDRN
jgi:hypothetical protein